MVVGRVRIEDLTDRDAGSARYCGHSIGRVLDVPGVDGVRRVLVDRVEICGDRVYGIGPVVDPARAVVLQRKWDIRWGRRAAPAAPAVPAAPRPDRPPRAVKFADVDGAAAAIVAAGYRELAKRHHPDAGGDHASMSLLTQAKKQLCQILDLAKEKK